MIKVVFCLHRKPLLSISDFRTHWYQHHAPLVQKHQKTLRILRYVQLHTDNGSMSKRLRGFRNSPEPFDGVAEIWYDSIKALEGLGDDREARAASRELRDDEETFVDLTRSPIWIGTEMEIALAL